MFDGYEAQLDKKSLVEKQKKELTTRLRSLRVQTHELLQEISRFGSAVTSRPGASQS